jgi:hypothetical protein
MLVILSGVAILLTSGLTVTNPVVAQYGDNATMTGNMTGGNVTGGNATGSISAFDESESGGGTVSDDSGHITQDLPE